MPRQADRTGQKEELDGADDAIVRRRKARESRRKKNAILLLACCAAVVLAIVGIAGVVGVMKVGGKVMSAIPREQSEEDVLALVDKLRAKGMVIEVERSASNDIWGMGPFAECKTAEGGVLTIQQKKTTKDAEVVRSMNDPKKGVSAFAYGRFAIIADINTAERIKAALNLTTGP